MRPHRLSVRCVVLLIMLWLHVVLALPQPGSESSSSAQRTHGRAVRPAASDDASEGASTARSQPAQQQQQQRAAQTIMRHATEQHSAQRSLLAQTRTTESGPVHNGVQHLHLAARFPNRHALSSHSHPSRPSAKAMAAHTALADQQASQSDDAHARHALLEASQLPQPRRQQQAVAGFGRRVIDSGPALGGGVRLSTAELMAAGSSLSNGQSGTLAAAAQREEGAKYDSQEAAESSSAAVAATHRSQVVASGLSAGDSGADEEVRPQRSAVHAAAALEPARGGRSVVPQALAAQSGADSEPEGLGAAVSAVAAGGASGTDKKGSGPSLGAAEVAPGEDAWWRRVRQDPEQCGIVDAAPSTVLRSLEEHTPDACGQLCRCEDLSWRRSARLLAWGSRLDDALKVHDRASMHAC